MSERPMTSGRRSLQFATLEEAVADAERLLDGYRSLGQWSLGQVCRHLSRALLGSMRRAQAPDTEAPVAPTPEQLAARQRVLDEGTFPEGAPIPFEPLVPPAGLE